MNEIIGREKEIKILKSALTSKTAEFVAVYGRRRVGKTYLIKQFFSNQPGIFFEQTGLNKGTLKEQLAIFAQSLAKAFYGNATIAIPNTWMDALRELTNAIDQVPKNKHITLFFDELPWISTRKSGFLKALEYFWNTHWAYRKKFALVVCGSAASWMIEKLIYAKGGLHNRITITIPLLPFNLRETKLFLKYYGANLNEQQIVSLYMAVGGIPHYLKAVRRGQSAAQIINSLCFQKGGLLFDEFDKLFSSLYEEPDIFIAIVRTIAKKLGGISRDGLISAIKTISDGGTLNVKLKSLEEAGFITSYLPVGHTSRGIHFRVIDEYVLFYLTWIELFRKRSRGLTEAGNHWALLVNKPVWHNWAGRAFEATCYKHVAAIKKAIGIQDVICSYGDWRYTPDKASGKLGAQIDLIFDREDGCISLCEIKYTAQPFIANKEFIGELARKQAVFKEQTRTKKQLFWVLISANGAVENDYLIGAVSQVVKLEELFC